MDSAFLEWWLNETYHRECFSEAESLECRLQWVLARNAEPATVQDFVYVIRDESWQHKIGRTNNIKRRMGEIGCRDSHLAIVLRCNRASEVERQLHLEFEAMRTWQFGATEWFNLRYIDLVWIVGRFGNLVEHFDFCRLPQEAHNLLGLVGDLGEF